jgi:hypothetical protein
MEDNVMLKRILKGRLYSKRRKGKPRMSDREQWRLVVEEAKAHPGL